MRTKLLPLFLVLTFIQFSSFAQRAEKIYVHTDKDFYLPGETIWFKAYLMEHNSISSKTNLYAGIYDENGQLLLQKTFPVFSGSAAGDFAIPDSTASSNFQLRLYTCNKEVSGLNDFVFPVRVFQKSMMEKHPLSASTASPLKIFPEGGQLVSGVNNYINFYLPQIPSAVLIDENGKTIDSLFFDATGYAQHQLTP